MVNDFDTYTFKYVYEMDRALSCDVFLVLHKW